MATANKGIINQAMAKPAKKAAKKMDPKLIAATQRYEVSYEAHHDGKTAAEVKAAIVKAGHSRVKVRKILTGK